MTDRDRLIELIGDLPFSSEYENYNSWEWAEHFADYLLANGVIVQKQGEWKTTQEPLGWKDVECVECSACHETWILDEDFDFDFCKEVWHYCPNCGAKIKECEGK